MLSDYHQALTHLASSLVYGWTLYGSRFEDPTLELDIDDALKHGHDIDIRFAGTGRYADANSYTRLTGFQVQSKDEDLFRAMIQLELDAIDKRTWQRDPDELYRDAKRLAATKA